METLKIIIRYINEMSTIHTSTIIYSNILIASIFLTIYYCVTYEENYKHAGKNTPLANSLDDSIASYVLYVCAGYAALGISILFELYLDIQLDYNLYIVNDRMERFSTCLALIIPSIVLLYYHDSVYFTTLFPVCMTVKFYQCFCSVIALCNRLYPKIYNNFICICCTLLFTLCGIFSVLGIDEKLTVYHIVSSIIGSAAIVIYLITTFRWILNEKVLRNYRIFKVNLLTTKEAYVLAYVASMMFPVVLVFIAGLPSSLRWAKLAANDALIYVYSYGVYVLVINSIPVRVAKLSAMRLQDELISSKRRLIRYICHEIRSPINIVKSNLEFVFEDIHAKHPEEISILDEVDEMKQACDAAVNVLDDILHLESLEADRFKLECGYLPLMTTFERQLTTQGKLYAKQKDVELEVITNISQEIAESGYLFADTVKLQQVMRNLVANAVKFTPAGGHIKIKISEFKDFEIYEQETNMEELQEPIPTLKSLTREYSNLNNIVNDQHENKSNKEERSKETEKQEDFHTNIIWKTANKITTTSTEMQSHMKLTRSNSMKSIQSSENIPEFIYFTDVVIEVIDSGVGIRSDFLKTLFGEFTQFKPLELQGGGGSGLGLWICKEIILRHFGSIGCYSKGEGHGSKFMLVLPLYKKNPLCNTLSADNETHRSKFSIVINSSYESRFLGSALSLSPTAEQFAHEQLPKSDSMGNLENSLSIKPPSIMDYDSAKFITDSGKFDGIGSRKVSLSFYKNNKVYNENQIATDLAMDIGIARPLPMKKVLIVDDSPLNRKVLIKTIERYYSKLKTNGVYLSYQLHFEECEDGKDAINKVKKTLLPQTNIDTVNDPDSNEDSNLLEYCIIFIDNIMIDIHGPEAVAQIRRMDYRHPIVGVTGNAMTHDVETFLQAGANEVLKKPVKKEEIEIWIDLILQLPTRKTGNL